MLCLGRARTLRQYCLWARALGLSSSFTDKRRKRRELEAQLFLALFLNKEFFSSATNLSLKDLIFEEALFESTELLLLDDAVES